MAEPGYGTDSFAELVVLKAVTAVPLTLGGVFVALAVLEGANAVNTLVWPPIKSRSKEDTRNDYFKALGLAVGFLVYGLAVASIVYPE